MTDTACDNPTLAHTDGPHVWTADRSVCGRHNPWLIATLLGVPVFMEILDTSIANVALRHIAGALAAGEDESTWVITSYLVANAIILPASAWLCDILGRKRFFIACTVLFTFASLLCGLATSLPMLIFFRVLQGLSGGGLVPCAQAMLADSFPPEKRGLAFTIQGLAVIVSPVLGPPLGGWITDHYSWEWCFLINVPVGIACAVLCSVMLHETPLLIRERKAIWARGIRFDYCGFALAAIGLACLEVTLSRGERKDWLESEMIRYFASAATIGLIGAFLWGWFAKEPVLDAKLFRNRTFRVCTLMMFGVAVELYGSTVIIPMLLQGCHGYTAYLAGLALMPGGIVSAFTMALTGFLTRSVSLRVLLAIGLILQIASFAIMGRFSADLTFADATIARVWQGLGIGFLFTPIMTLAYVELAPHLNNAASTLINIARNIGGSVGISLCSTYLATRTQFHHAMLAEHITPYTPIAAQAIETATTALQAVGVSEPVAETQTMVAINAVVTQQSAIMAFNDVFVLSGVLCVALLLLVPILPYNKPLKASDGPAMH
jgi:DHA2 family multidrug resistance protein